MSDIVLLSEQPHADTLKLVPFACLSAVGWLVSDSSEKGLLLLGVEGAALFSVAKMQSGDIVL